MRFLFFTGGWTMGGMETAFLSLMKGLVGRGHQPTAIVSGWTDGEVPRLLDEAGIPHHEVSLGRFYVSNPVFTWHTLRCMPAARRQLRAIAADVRPDWVVYSALAISCAGPASWRTATSSMGNSTSWSRLRSTSRSA